MKHFCFILVFFMQISILSAQEEETKPYSLPYVDIQTMNDKSINVSDAVDNGGKPVILCIWATWCKPCIKEFDAISKVYQNWKDETGVKLIAVSIDDPHTISNVAPLISKKGWQYEFYLDPNNNLMKALHVNFIPNVFIIDGGGNIVWQHNSYEKDDEQKYIDIVRKIINKQSISK